MAYCVNCGKEYEEGEKFCTACGAPINGEVKSENENKSENESESKTFSPPVQNADNQKSVSFLSANKYYILGALVVIAFVGVFFYITSMPKEPADVGMQKFCQAYINGDMAMLKEFDKDGKSDKRPLKERLREKEADTLQKEFEGMTRLQSETIADAVLDKVFTNNSVSCRLIEQNGKEAKVGVTVDTYNFDYVNQNFNDRIRKRLLTLFTPTELSTITQEEVRKQLVIVWVELIGEAKPVGRRDFRINCVYNSEKGVWEPKKFDNFVKKAHSAVDENSPFLSAFSDILLD